ncbi:MAG: mRNA surveillance protein pelota [Candidatus Nezhaarchaeota archaeon]|nr:mRNA surveillance protein pelota [Candidatus Nezhaarchaeota archaeon]
MFGSKVRALDEKVRALEVVVESEDDLWVLYNTLERGDVVRAWTTRELKTSSGSRRKAMKVALRVEHLELQPFTTKLRIHGFIVEGPRELDLEGQRHTLAIDLHDELVIYRERGWPRHVLERLKEACEKLVVRALVVGVDYDEAAVALVRGYGVEVLAELAFNLPGRLNVEARQKELELRIRELGELIVSAASKYEASAVIVAGPGFVKEAVASQVEAKGRGALRVYLETAAQGGVAGVYEALRRKAVARVLRDHELVIEEGLVEELMEALAKRPSLVAYTLSDVEAAVKAGAVEKLLVSGDLLRSVDEEVRRRVEELVRGAELRGAYVKVFSSLHEAHSKLRSLGGVAAILRFSLPAGGVA